jgi:hypothetical protein
MAKAPELPGCSPKRIAAAAKKLRCNFAARVPYQTVDDLIQVSLFFRSVREGGGDS